VARWHLSVEGSVGEILDVVREVLRVSQRGLNRLNDKIGRAIVVETDEQFDQFAGGELQ
jgi:hypothetical protein